MEDVSPSPGHSVQRTSKDTHVSFTGWGRGEKAWGRREERVMRGKMGAGCDSWTCSAGAARPGGWSRSHTQLFVVFLLHREAGYFPEPGRRISVAWPPSPAAHMTSVVGKPLKMAQKTRMWAKKGANIHFFQNSGALQAPWRLQLVTVPGPAFNKWLKGEKKKNLWQRPRSFSYQCQQTWAVHPHIQPSLRTEFFKPCLPSVLTNQDWIHVLSCCYFEFGEVNI